MRLKVPLPTHSPVNQSGWGGTRVGTRSTTVAGIGKPRRPVSLAQAPAIGHQLVKLVASNPKPEYTPAEVQASIGPVAYQVRGMVFAMLGWRYRSVRRNNHAVRIWAAPLNPEGIPMPTDNPEMTAALALIEADRLKDKNLKLIELWLDTAGATLREPAKTGRDINRTGELLLAAGNWLTEERKRIADGERARLHSIRSAARDAEFNARYASVPAQALTTTARE